MATRILPFGSTPTKRQEQAIRRLCSKLRNIVLSSKDKELANVLETILDIAGEFSKERL